MTSVIQPPAEGGTQAANTLQILVQLAESLSHTFFNGRGADVLGIVALGMAVVEKFAIGRNLSGRDKLKLATDVAPELVDLLVRQGIVAQDKAAVIKENIRLSGALGDSFIQWVAWLTNNPGLIQSDADAPPKKMFLCC